MTNRIALWIAAAFLAVTSGSQLTELMKWIDKKWLGEKFPISLLEADVSNDLDRYVALVVATILFWVALKLFGPLLGFFWPATQRFGATKPVRRIQGIFAEVMFAVLFFVLLTGFAMAVGEEETGNAFGQMRRTRADFVLRFKSTVDDTWGLTLPLAMALYLCLALFGRRRFAVIYCVVHRFVHAGSFGIGGSARLAALFEEWTLRWGRGDGGLFMGRSLYSRSLHVSMKDDRHMLTIAGSRGGKGATAIIPNLLLWEGSALVIDPKGTNAAVTAQRRREMGHAVHIVDPFDVLNTGETAGFNPLSALDPTALDIREQIAVIADALVVPDLEVRDRHWDDGARTVLAGLITQLVSRYENPSLPLLRKLLSMGEEEQTELWADMSINDEFGGAAKAAASRILRGIGTDEMSGILSNADKHTEWLLSFPMEDVLAKTTFTFADLKEKPTTIYLILPPHYLETHNRFLRLFVNLAIRQMSVGGRSKIPVLMILDEFLALGHMSEVEKAFGLMAGYNFVLWPFVQDLGRLKDLYKNSVNAFVNNSRAVQVFAISDEATTKFVSDRIGERSMSAVPGTGQLMRVVPFRTPTETAKEVSTESNCQYILRAGKAPLILEKVRYYEDSGAPRMLHRLPLWMRRRLYARLYPFRELYGQDPDFAPPSAKQPTAQQALKSCANCGSDLDHDSRFCQACGSPIALPESQSALSVKQPRHGCLTTALIAMLLLSILLAFSVAWGFLVDGRQLQWEPLLVSLQAGFNVVCAVAIWRWRRWGFWCFVASGLVTSVPFLVFHLWNDEGPVVAAVCLLGPLALYGVLHIGKTRKAWPRLR